MSCSPSLYQQKQTVALLLSARLAPSDGSRSASAPPRALSEIILTSNKAFADWAEVFAADPIMASAALDRLLHRSTVVHIRGDSYWLKEKRQAKSQPLEG